MRMAARMILEYELSFWDTISKNTLLFLTISIDKPLPLVN